MRIFRQVQTNLPGNRLVKRRHRILAVPETLPVFIPEPFCCRTGWKITLVGSRFTHAAESRYAPVEGEALAVADALDKARFFVLGCSNLIIAVDHKPLLKVFGDRSLEEINQRPAAQPKGENLTLPILHGTHPRRATQSC